MPRRLVSYFRVSTDRQGRSSLGLEAQRAAVAAHLSGGAWMPLDEMIEVESGKATADRPQLALAMALCRLTGATLCVTRLDRLSRDARFLIGLGQGRRELRGSGHAERQQAHGRNHGAGRPAGVRGDQRSHESGAGRGQDPGHEAGRLGGWEATEESCHRIPPRPAPPVSPKPTYLRPASDHWCVSCKGQAWRWEQLPVIWRLGA